MKRRVLFHAIKFVYLEPLLVQENVEDFVLFSVSLSVPRFRVYVVGEALTATKSCGEVQHTVSYPISCIVERPCDGIFRFCPLWSLLLEIGYDLLEERCVVSTRGF